jgi:glycerol-3-phosphate acyltransferase PlsY
VPNVLGWLVVVVGGYLVGSLPTAARVAGRRGLDPTQAGSGNPGATNVYRLAGRRAGLLVLAGDMVKGMAAAGAGLAVGGHLEGVVAGAAAVVGHCFPLGRHRRGGKGVATASGVVIVLFPLVAAGAAVVWIALVKLTRTASLASLVTAALAPVAVAFVGRPAAEVVVLSGISVLVIARHHGNLGRLLRGEEGSLH